MRYGVPYKGSKNGIAEWVYSHFPKLTNFYDLFAGGCAITQIALMKGHFQRYFANDLDFDGITIFMEAIHGRFRNETRWISREDFFRLKDKDPYIKYCWSFGNNGRDYLYSKEIEPYKKAWHYAIFFHDYSLAEKLGLDLKSIEPIQNIYDRYIATKRITEKFTDENMSREINFERQQQLEALNRLQSLQSLQLSNCSYENVKIYKDSVVFCDIPYYQTNAYGSKNINTFDYEKFYSWCEKQTELLFISEYFMPPDSFICIDSIEKPVMELVKMNPECFDVPDAELKEAIWQKLDEQTGTLEDGTYRDEVRSPRNKMKVYHFELPCTDEFEFDVTSIEVKRVR